MQKTHKRSVLVAGAAAYTTCVTWVAFFPVYAVTEARALSLCACVSLSAGACVALSLGPRLWVSAYSTYSLNLRTLIRNNSSETND